MIQRIIWSLLSICSGAWIAGYMAIVLPVIFKRMQPGTQNGNFTMWADIGWVFFAVMLCLCIATIILSAKNNNVIRAIITGVLILSIGLFQYLSQQNTYAVAAAFEQRNQTHENTERYKKHDSLLKAAHKSSERNVGVLLILLLGQIGTSLYAISVNGPRQTGGS